MAARDPRRVQLDFPELNADLIRELNLTGQLGVLELSDQVTPVVLVGTPRGEITAVDPVFLPGELFGAVIVQPGANAVIVQTPALAAGDYDIIFFWSCSNITTGMQIALQHRNAADTANVRVLNTTVFDSVGGFAQSSPVRFGYRIGLNETLRWLNVVNLPGVTETVSVTVYVHLRPVP